MLPPMPGVSGVSYSGMPDANESAPHHVASPPVTDRDERHRGESECQGCDLAPASPLQFGPT